MQGPTKNKNSWWDYGVSRLSVVHRGIGTSNQESCMLAIPDVARLNEMWLLTRFFLRTVATDTLFLCLIFDCSRG